MSGPGDRAPLVVLHGEVMGIGLRPGDPSSSIIRVVGGDGTSLLHLTREQAAALDVAGAGVEAPCHRGARLRLEIRLDEEG